MTPSTNKRHKARDMYFTLCGMPMWGESGVVVVTNWRDVTCLTCARLLGVEDALRALWQNQQEQEPPPEGEQLALL